MSQQKIISPAGPSDELLLSDVREGKLDSFGVLYERYVGMARAVALKHTSNPTLSDDIVSEAFVRILQALKNGKGPRSFMGGYLATTIAHLSAENGLIARKEVPSEDEHLEAMGSLDDTVLRLHESDELISAFTALPERWQTVLWMTEVEAKKPREVATSLNLSANAVSALATRARESLREGFLRAHQGAPKTLECEKYGPHLSSMVRGSLTKKRSEALRLHLSECNYCTSEYLMLAGINKSMRVWVFPVLAGLAPIITDGSRALAPYLAGGAVAGGGLAVTSSSTGSFVHRFFTEHQPLAGVAAVITAVGAVAGGVALVGSVQQESATITADSPRQPEQSVGPDVVLDDVLVGEQDGSGVGIPVSRSGEPLISPATGEREREDSSVPATSLESSELAAIGGGVLSPHSDGDPTSIEQGEDALPEGTSATSEWGFIAGDYTQGDVGNDPSAPAVTGEEGLAAGGATELQSGQASGESTEATQLNDPSPTSDAVAPASPAIPADPAKPVSPVELTDPTEPTDPAKPGNPADPTDPVDPTDPADPTDPVEPSDPTDPVDPTDPAKPGNPAEPTDPADPTDPGDPADGRLPDNPYDWVGTADYYRFMASVPWDSIGKHLPENTMCRISYSAGGVPAEFGTYVPKVILEHPFASFILEGYFGVERIDSVLCYP